MEFYIEVSFWMSVVGIILNAIFLMMLPYPRQRTKTAAEDFLMLVIGVIFAVWAGRLLWGSN